MQPALTVRVVRKQPEADDICSFELAEAGGGPLPPFAAGAHIDVHVGGHVRQYSLCNNPQEQNRYLIAVLKVPASRGGSLAMHALQEADEIRISVPRNHFALTHTADRSLLLAGGIGVTPLLCMAERLAHVGADWEMHYCTRAPSRTAFADRIRRAAFAPQVHFHFDDGPPAQRFDIGTVLDGQPQATHLYVCGPQGFMTAVLTAARARSWPESQLHCEYFSADVGSQSGDREFEIVLASSGKVIRVGSAETALAALQAAGVDVPSSCEQGVCGTCLTRVLDGEPDHRDQYMTQAEQALNDQFTPCCSRAKSARLTVDL